MITKPLLAATIKPDQTHLIKYPVLASPKLDGIRALMVDGKLVSRNFKPIPNKFVREMCEKHLPDGLDGELMLQDKTATFQEISSAIMSHDGEPDFAYHAFDYAPTAKYLEMDFLSRQSELQNSVRIVWEMDYLPFELIHCLSRPIESEEELAAYEEECLTKGYEGVMIRSSEGVYKCGRSTLKEGILIKLKRFSDSEAVITGFEEKETNTNEKKVNELGYAKRSSAKAGKIAAGTLGNFLVRDIHSGIEFKVGSGLTDALRDTIWEDKDSYVGKVIKYKSLLIGVKEKPRHPVFLGFRHADDL